MKKIVCFAMIITIAFWGFWEQPPIALASNGLTYPADCDTPAERTEWLYAAQELLRHTHNLFSYWFHNKITQVQYDNPPLPDVPIPLKTAVRRIFTYLKNKYPYKVQLTQEDWDKFYREDFKPRSNKICTQINVQRQQLKESIKWSPNVEDI